MRKEGDQELKIEKIMLCGETRCEVAMKGREEQQNTRQAGFELRTKEQYLTARSVTSPSRAWIMSFQSAAPGWTLPWLTATRSKVRSFSAVQLKGIVLGFEMKDWGMICYRTLDGRSSMDGKTK